MMTVCIPLIIGLVVAFSLYWTVGWWGFLVIFPWIGLSISIGIYLADKLPSNQKDVGRRVAILLVLPALLLFVPIFNNENFQLEGVALLVFVGYFSKGFIHYAVAKLFGPFIWGRGFCGWACWTAAVLEWLPVKKSGRIPGNLKNIRYISLGVSIILPVMLIFFLNFNVRTQYLNKQEMIWMFAGNLLYYILAIPLAFVLKDKRAFCKVLCPVSLVMKVTAKWSLIKISPTGNPCIECGNCNRVCPMNVDVMSYIRNGQKVKDTECILCSDCSNHCPVNAIK